MSLRSTAVLARWLGPWASTSAVPAGISRRTLGVPPERAGDRPFDAYFYGPSRPARGAWLVVPGLHFRGPDDARLDRLCRVLAAAGSVVLCPFLPDPIALRVTPETPADVERAFAALLAQPEVPRGAKPAVFSISFGSAPALKLAASPRFADRIGALVVFGGYADFAETIRFVLTGESDGAKRFQPDPLNRPVVYLNVVAALPGVPPDRAPLLDAWHRFCVETWGRPEMKAGGWREVAERLATGLPEEARPLFRLGVGLDDRSRAVAEEALARFDTGFCDPSRGGLEGIRCEVHAVHGAGDDVIPAGQLAKLAAALPPQARVRTHLTGIYGHADRAGVHPAILAREIRTLWRVLRVLARATGSF